MIKIKRELIESVYAAPLLVVVVKILLHLPALDQYGIFVDEYYYIACSERLAWGYVDHPPLAVALLSALRNVFGESIYVLRIPVMLVGAGTVFVAGMMAREAGGGPFSQAVAALAVVAAPIYTGIDKFYTTNSFEIFFWSLAIYLLLRILNRGATPGLWLALGGVFGAGLLNKHSMLFLGFGVAVALVMTRERRRLLGPGPYLTAALAFAIFAPHIVWQVAKDWPTLEFMQNARLHKNYFAFGDFVSAQFLQQHPLLAPLWLGGLAFFAFARSGAPFRMVAWIYIALFALFVLMQGKTYYLSPVYPVLYVGGAVWLEACLARIRETKGAFYFAQGLVLLLIALGGAVLAPLSLPLLSPENYLAYERSLGLKPPKLENHDLEKMPQHFASMFGYARQARAAIDVFEGLPAQERRRAVVLGSSYGFAGSVEYYARQAGLDIPVLSGHNNYYFWSSEYLLGRGAAAPEIFVVLGYSRERVSEAFADVRAAGTVHCEYCMERHVDVTVFICRRPKVSVRAFFESQRRFQ
ncbi:MAG: glycosyltransferase family 39 protein [Leptospirales bacterium]|jgi:4-amino-4-deoxy-L-arabinose transferase-like glycosyltransferase